MPLLPARFELNDEGVPWSGAYGDVYHSASGAAEQTEHVFLAGNGLPERWQKAGAFVIVETGFGLGLNFLHTWRRWRETRPAGGQLHYLSIEKHPFSREDLALAHANAGAPAELAHLLQEHWPELSPGLHRLEFESEALTLSLGFGEVLELLPCLEAKADAVFLDGFSPAQNPDMWSAEVFEALAALSHAGTTLATWSVAGRVREGLRAAGFEVEQAPGFGGKRQMLKGRFGTRQA